MLKPLGSRNKSRIIAFGERNNNPTIPNYYLLKDRTRGLPVLFGLFHDESNLIVFHHEEYLEPDEKQDYFYCHAIFKNKQMIFLIKSSDMENLIMLWENLKTQYPFRCFFKMLEITEKIYDQDWE